MIKNYLKSAIRSFSKNKFFSILNVTGLAIGFSACIMIMQYVKYERSYDTFNSKAEDIYRLQYNHYRNGKLNFECAAAVPAAGPALLENFPEVLSQARLLPEGGVMTYNDPEKGPITSREVNNIQVTEPSVFDIFDIELISGNKETCIDAGGKIAISEKAAKKYFGDTNPMGKTLVSDGRNDFEVTAVFKDLPDNSHIKFDFLVNHDVFNEWTGDWDWESSWGWYDHNTYVLLQEGTDVKDLQARWDEYLFELHGESWEENDRRSEFILQPLLDIHLYSNLLQESRPEEQGDGTSVYFLTIIAFFILIIAWVNYINLSTAKSMERANEVGVRKVMGAYKRQLTFQFLTEAFILNLLAVIVSLVIVFLAWPWFTNLTGRAIPLSTTYLPSFWLMVLGLFLLGTFLSGFYPSLVISAFKPIVVLKGKVFRTSKGSFFRKALVVFQFTASIVLISGTLIVQQQLEFMRNKDLGININETLVLKGPGISDSLYSENLKTFKKEVNQLASVKGMSASTNVPGDEIYWTNSMRRISGSDATLTVYNVGIDQDYIPQFNLDVLAGRNFRESEADVDRVILNRALAEYMEFDDFEKAIGDKVRIGGDTMEIAGIIENYHQMSLKTTQSPIVFRFTTPSSFYSFKIESGNYQDVLGSIQDEWNASFPGNPFDYFFLDEFFNKQYDSDSRFGKVFSLFSIMAIIVACLGLFGLASFMTSQRTKEIGIRKALGSSIQGIVTLLSSGFIKLVLVANIFAWPLSWYLMNEWLQGFPYRIDVNIAVIILSGLMVIIIALLSVSFQTIKAALLNPANTLRYE